MSVMVPSWLLSTLERELPAAAHFVNAIRLEGRRELYLVNTSQGAVLVEKSAMGEPKVHRAPLPPQVDARCLVCDERVRFLDLDLPAEKFCPECGQQYLIEEDGTLRRLHETRRSGVPWTEFEDVPDPDGPQFERYDGQAVGAMAAGPSSAKVASIKAASAGASKAAGKPGRRGGSKAGRKSGSKSGGKRGRPAGGKPAASKEQCQALTGSGVQCKNGARARSNYCGHHKGYQPKTEAGLERARDTVPRSAKVDTKPGAGGKAGDQCAALTAAGVQCKFTSRPRSKYCGSHVGYRGPVVDTVPRRALKDTAPKVRKASKTGKA